MKWKPIIFSLLVVSLFLSRDVLFVSFEADQQLTLVLLLLAMYLWIAAPIPTGAASILILASMLLLGLVDTIEQAVVGFLSPALYFIFMLSMISHVLVKVRIDRAIARLFIKMSKGGARQIVFGLPIFMMLLPILLPSAAGRFKMLLPIMNRLNEYYGFKEKSLFKKFSLYVIGIMNQHATMIIFTGGGFPILAAQLLQDYQIANISWLGWFLSIAPPLWIGLTITTIFVWQYLKHTVKDEDWDKNSPSNMVDIEKTESMPTLFWIVLGSFLLMILSWIVLDHETVPILLAPMILVVFYSLPKLGLIDNKVIRDYDWENFLLLGSAFSLGILIESNGTAKVLANQLIHIIPREASLVVSVIVIASLVFLMRLLFIQPSSAVIVIFPIIISYAEALGMEPISLAFLIIIIVGSVIVMPIQSVPAFYAYDTKIFTKREQYTIGIVTSVFLSLIAILAALYYW